MHIFFSVGEPSGDQHAARLMKELQNRQPDVRLSGFGGIGMEQAGLESLFRLTDMAVMGFQALPLVGKFFRLVRRAEQFLQDEKPDAVVLVDFPGFNWWIARLAKAAGIPVFYYLPPQLWAWAPWRIRKVRRFIDHIISSLPFEREWYRKHGVSANYVGHPFFDEVAEKQLDESFVAQWKNRTSTTIAVLPGSRTHEVTYNFPSMVEIMKRLHARHPDVTFLLACFRDEFRRECLKELLVRAPTLPVQIFVGKTAEIIEAADCALMVSGSVSLEMLARKTPAAVIYRTSRLTHALGNRLLNCKYFSLPNLIADRPVMPEFLSSGDPSGVISEMTELLDLWIRLPEERQKASDELQQAVGDFPETGATRRAAEFILKALEPLPATRPDGISKAA